VRNEWNFCQEFELKGDSAPYDDESESDGEIGYRSCAPAPSHQRINIEGTPVRHSTVEQIEAKHYAVAEEIHVEDPAVKRADEQAHVKHDRADRMDVEPSAVEQINTTPHDDEQGHVEHNTTDRIEPSAVEQINTTPHDDEHGNISYLISLWEDPEEFLYKRFGLMELSCETDTGQHAHMSTSLGLTRKVLDINTVNLYTSFLENRWPDDVCDLSPDRHIIDGVFPSRSPNAALNPTAFGKKYLLSVGHPRCKLLVEDPITLLQIEREEWDTDPDSLVENLVKKGLPFEVLNTLVEEWVPFHDHSDSEVRPTAAPPTQGDYVAYRRKLSSFFLDYPHAYAAALCAGGILWRIAMDALPPPGGQNIVRAFHKRVCSSRTVGGEVYWTPKLTTFEEHLIVGAYRWSESG